MHISYFKAPTTLAACLFPVQDGVDHTGREAWNMSVEMMGLVMIYIHMLFIFF